MTERTPNVGVTCNIEIVKYGIWTEPAAMVPLTYVRAIARAGGRPLLIAPTPADLAEPELYGLLLAHFALRRLMVDASRRAGCDPDTLSFLHTVRIVRRHLPFQAAFSPSSAPAHG